MNSTLGSVVPLAMFVTKIIVQSHKIVYNVINLIALAGLYEPLPAKCRTSLKILKMRITLTCIIHPFINEW